MNKYCKHFLMDIEEAKNYSKEVIKYFDYDEKLEGLEIGDGNINYVFKIWNPETQKSLVIKQADKLLRSSGRPLDVYRNKIEAEILKIQGELAPEYVPKIYYYDDVMYALAMEDISEYKNLRIELLKGKTFNHLADNISTFLVRTLLPTTDLIMDRAKKKENVKMFVNAELCDISEDLVFTEPYYNYKNRNVVLECNKKFVEKNLYNNEKLKCQVGILRDKFMNQSQALIHGDLHSGSIFINEKGIKVIDPEFAFYGPMGYDIGNVIGNLFFAWANKYYTEKGNVKFLEWIEETIRDIYDLLKNKFYLKFDTQVNLNIYNEKFKKCYVDEILSDSLGYAGTEMIRRVVGDSKVLDITSIDNVEQRIKVERSIIKMGMYLIEHRNSFKSGEDIVNVFNMIID